jgi:hypothetical protein
MTAFSNAILEQIYDPYRNVEYELVCNGKSTPCRASDYLSVRREEGEMISLCLSGQSEPSILDLGACVGRHSRTALDVCPRSIITIVEQDDQLRQHCIEKLQPYAAYAEFSEIPDDQKFDVVFMLGLGLGIFGNENQTSLGLENVIQKLKLGGSLLIEGGKSTCGEFTTQSFTIRYGLQKDEPFQWGYASQSWLKQCLSKIGSAQITDCWKTSNGDDYFICQVKRLA